MSYQIIDNFLDIKDFLKIKEVMLSSNFEWFYNDFVSKKKLEDGFYFFHNFYNNNVFSSKINLIQPILSKIKPKSIIRIKGNFYPKTEKIIEHGSHIDYNIEHKAFLFYLNNNDGFTRLHDGTIVKSVENRGLFFNAHVEHNSSTCTNQNGRININFNYF